MIREIGYEAQSEWNFLVRSFSNYEVFYLNEYVNAFRCENSENGSPILLYYENENDRAINVVFKRDIAKDKYMKGKIEENRFFDLISPYGYGGFKGSITNYSKLNDEYNKYCEGKGYICEFVRFDLFGEYYKYYDGECETRTHNVIRNLEISMDELWMDFKQKVRKNVKKAINSNLGILIENTDDHIQDFLKIYYATMDRSKAEKDYYFSNNFYKMLGKMPDNRVYFYVIYNQKIISAELVLYGANNCYSYLGGTDQEYFDLRPNDFLKYEVIKWAHDKGLKNFVLGGGYGADDGIFQYKTYLAPHGIVDFYIGRKIFNIEIYNKLVDIRKKDNPDCICSKFFPKYRA